MKKILALLAVVFLLLSGAALAEEALPDGVYEPAAFTFTGGSGKITITCAQVEVKDGKAWATLVFSSPNYGYVKLDGVEYEGSHTEDSSTFVVPAPLERSFTLTGMTTAMSRPHEIDYELCIRLSADAAALPGLEYVSSLQLDYAECFSVDYYEGGYALVAVTDGRRYLVVPEGKEPPEGLDPAIFVLQKPLDRVYMAASAVMSLYARLDAVDSVRFSALKEEDWTVPAAAEAMQRGEMLFGGKYSEPVYELLVKEDCCLAVESTMILHTPKVQEMIEMLGIPVLIDRSSYESEPLGRTEWIKLYGLLTDREDEAARFFAEQAAAVEALRGCGDTGKTVAFFYINTDGSAVVRSGDDYIARCVEIAGGTYAFADLESSRSTVTLSMEEFYAKASDVDCLIYNTSIDTELEGVDDLVERSPLFRNFAAVQSGNVWRADHTLYQATDTVGSLIVDLSRMLQGETDGMTFLTKME